ncbi:hypothetical protein E8E11_002528 [Didymella keratinophila]|nr:hypothetical protein E8E11_002528 [Didymella keratinophila]
MTPQVTQTSDDLYDKLSQVSVSHRRLNSFEWVMTQSAPNTPPTSGETSHKSFSPPPQRPAASAPLPVPGELWSTGPRRKIGKPQRGYFDWWSSPSLSNGTGYAMIPNSEEHEEENVSYARRSITTPSIPYVSEGRRDAERSFRASSTCGIRGGLRLCHELNALGIVLPDTPPPSPPPTLEASNTAELHLAHQTPSSTSPSRPPKRVTFSPIVDEVTLESFSDFNEQHPTHWGSYLPSSFLVARPSLPRTTSMPATQAKTATRPILRRSTSFMSQITRNTEMTYLSAKGDESTPVVVSSIPAPRPSVSHSPVTGHASRGTNEADKAFASLLRATHKPSPRRYGSLLSNRASR